MDDKKKLQELIKASLIEDIGKGDITTNAIIDDSKTGRANIKAKQDGILAGINIVQMVFKTVDQELAIDSFVKDGQQVDINMQILKLSGKISSILKAERTALNFLAHLSGIASLTADFVNRVQGTNAKITDTRKTTPLLRNLEKYAVTCGGGVNHRTGLFDMILIKENHIKAAGGIYNAVNKSREYLKIYQISSKIVVETTNLSEVTEAIDSGVDRIMLDNMQVDMIKQAVNLVARRAETEASGGISLDNVNTIARTGVDFISIGALTHSAPAFDFSLLLEED